MKKNDLVKIVCKKAEASDNSAKELFDVFLLRIANKITVGQTAHFENVGYFHLRKGKIRKTEKEAEKEIFDHHDFLILSQSPELNINSLSNLVLRVPEIEYRKGDSIDSHFSLSANKPGLQNNKDKNPVSQLKQLSDENIKDLEEKVDNILLEVKIEDSINSKTSVLLLDIKKHDKDQSEAKLNNKKGKISSIKSSDDETHRSESPKIIAGKDLSEQKDEKSIPNVTEDKVEGLDIPDATEVNFDAHNWETVSEPLNENKIELDKDIYENVANVNMEAEENSNNIYEDLNKPIMGASENSENKGKKPTGSGDDNVNPKFKRIKLKDTSSSPKKTTEKKVNRKEPLGETTPNKFDEEENKKLIKAIDEDNQMHTEKFKEPSKIKESLASMSELEEGEYSFETNTNESYGGNSNKRLGMVLLIIVGAIVIIGGGFYLFFWKSGSNQIDNNNITQIDRAVNTTYINRNYDIPISYPYTQPESEVEIHGLGSGLSAGEVSEEQTKIEESTTKVINKKEVTPPVINKKETTPPVTNEKGSIPKKSETEKVSTVPTGQVALNIFKYNETYAVQVGAFRSKKSAEDGVAKFNKSGYSAFVEEAKVDGKKWYRLRVGGFKTLEDAKQFQNSKK